MASALLFDLDGTLVDSESQTDAAIAAVMARSRRADFKRLSPYETRGRTWADIARALGGDDDLAKELAEEWARSIDAMMPIKGSPRALREAAEMFDIGIVSSSPHALVDRVLLHLGVSNVIDVCIGGDDVTNPKPNPECFLHAASKLGLDPEACVVFEDSAAGLEAAREANMRSVLVLAQCAEPDRCRAIATMAIEDYDSIPSDFWARLAG